MTEKLQLTFLRAAADLANADVSAFIDAMDIAIGMTDTAHEKKENKENKEEENGGSTPNLPDFDQDPVVQNIMAVRRAALKQLHMRG